MSLDRRKPAHPLLEAKFKQFMDALELASDGRTTSFGDKLSGGHDSGSPASASLQDTRHWHREWRAQKTDQERLELLAEIQRYVSRLHFAPHNATRRGTLEWRQAIAHDEREPEDVWIAYDISRTTYYRFRQDLNPTRPRRRR